MAVPVSIIVPVLNEAPIIAGFLRHLREVAPRAEIIVVDGGSNDGTAEFCCHIADYVITAPLGRAKQMNAGAKIATGDIFWFVHADSRITHASVPAIEAVLADPKIAGGCFRLRYRSVALDLPNSRCDRKFLCRMVWCRARRPRIFLPARCFSSHRQDTRKSRCWKMRNFIES